MGRISEPASRGCYGDEVRNMCEAWTRPGICCQEVGFHRVWILTEKRKVARLSVSETPAWKTLLKAGSLFSVCVFASELLSVMSVVCLPMAAGAGNHEKDRKSARERHRTREREGVPSGYGTW